MKATSSSYASKVMKFQKKYAKPVPKTEEKDDLLQNNYSSISSESLEDSVGIIKSKLVPCSYVTKGIPQQKDNGLSTFRSFGYDISEASKGSSASSNPSVPGMKSRNRNSAVVLKDNSTKRYVTNEIKTNCIKSDIISLNDKDDNFTGIEEVGSKYMVEGDKNKTSVNKFVKECNRFHEDFSDKYHCAVVSSDKTECDVSEILEHPDAYGSHVQMNLSLSVDEDCDEITDLSKNSISVPYEENVGSIPNLPLHILNFEDLISTKEQETSVNKLNDNLNIKNNLSQCSEVGERNSKGTLSCIEDEFSCNSQNSESKKADSVSKVKSAMEYFHESQAEAENTDNSTIKEEIENILSDNCNELSDQRLTDLENSEDPSEVGTSAKGNTVSSVNEKEDKCLSKSVDLRSTHCCEENYASANKGESVSVTEIQSREVHEDMEKKMKYHDENSIKSSRKKDNFSYEGLKIASDQYSKMSRETEKTSSKYTKQDTKVHRKKETNFDKNFKSLKYVEDISKPKLCHAFAQTETFLLNHDNIKNCREMKENGEHATHKTKGHYKKEKYFNKSSKMSQNSKEVAPTNLHHSSTQTENLFIFKNYEFEKKMEAIMKSSFDSMMKMNTSASDLNDVFIAHSSHSASASSSPLERGFNCALMQQVELTKHFVEAEYKMYLVCSSAIKELSASYKPATLHYTRKIQKKKREKLRTERAKN